MRSQMDLQILLESILNSRNVYFQPPKSTQMRYPAIRYVRDKIVPKRADNGVFLAHVRYTVTLIDKNPNSETLVKLLSLPYCEHERHYEKDNLNHDVFTLYF